MYATATERDYLLQLQARAIDYFVDNQSPRTGLVLDRQANFGPSRLGGLWSSAATGMGFIALALGSSAPHHRLSRQEAIHRIGLGLKTALHRLPQTRGILPHFLDSTTGEVYGDDARSTVDTAWLLAGGLWAASFLEDPGLEMLAGRLFDRVCWRSWTGPSGLLRHGADQEGRPFPCCWDRLNGETVFLYILAAGAQQDRAWSVSGWEKLGAFHGEVAGHRFANADLGLFVFQYGLELLDLADWQLPGGRDLLAEASVAAQANAKVCSNLAARYRTYRYYWGLSASDGPGESQERSTYRCYSPSGPIDGTACLMVSLASLAHSPALVWENLFRARADQLIGRYGIANINLDRDWIGSDLVGIDAGAAVLALDNCLHDNRVRRVFHAIPAVQMGLERLGAQRTSLEECQKRAS